MSIGFDRSRDRRKRELTNIKNIKCKIHLRIYYLRDVFGFAEHQEVATCGLDYTITMKKNTDSAVINEDNAVNNAKIKIISLGWYVAQYTPSLEEYNKLMNQISKKLPTNLHYLERSVFMKKIITQIFWTFELGTLEGINVPLWVFVGFQQMDRQNDQNINNDTFYRMPVTTDQCISGTEKYTDSGILLNCNDDDYCQGYGQIKEVFRTLIKDDTLQPYISEDDFRSSIVGNDGNEIGYNIHAFDIRYQKNFESGQSVKVEFNFIGFIPAGIYGYALVLTNRLLSISSDGQRVFDLT